MNDGTGLLLGAIFVALWIGAGPGTAIGVALFFAGIAYAGWALGQLGGWVGRKIWR